MPYPTRLMLLNPAPCWNAKKTLTNNTEKIKSSPIPYSKKNKMSKEKTILFKRSINSLQRININ
jgi:hypothetical protein